MIEVKVIQSYSFRIIGVVLYSKECPLNSKSGLMTPDPDAFFCFHISVRCPHAQIKPEDVYPLLTGKKDVVKCGCVPKSIDYLKKIRKEEPKKNDVNCPNSEIWQEVFKE